MKIFNKLFGDCTEATHCCDKAQYKEASLVEKVKIHAHILLCQPCKRYTEKNTRLTELVKKANIKKCTEAEKIAWKKKIESQSST